MKHFFLLFFFFSLAAQAQFRISGIVKDESTNQVLPFASVSSDTGIFTIADVDGKFTIDSFTKVNILTVSYIGYAKKEIIVENQKKFYSVRLVPISDALHEVIISKNNPALAIIRQTINSKNNNNPQIRLNSFEFKAYNKLVITANPDSIDGRIDSIFIKKGRKRRLSKIDSSDYKFKKVIRQQHLFQTEKVSKYQFDKSDGLKETVLGTKMAGFKQPIYEILSFNLQSFSLYDDRYELFETKYNSPIATSSFSDYNFKLLDSISIQGRKTFMIYFKNKKKRKAAGLEGVLYIDSQNFAIAKAIMRIKGMLDITGTHEFKYLPNENLWFPINKNFKIVKGKNDDDIRILGETLKFDSDDNTSENGSRPKVASDFTYVLSETNYFDWKYNY